MITRASNTLLCAIATFGVSGYFVLTGTGPVDPAEPDPGVVVSVVQFFSYFTVQANLFVVITSLPLALGRGLSFPLRVLRLNAMVAIVITGVVHWFLLRPTNDVTGAAAVFDVVTHIVVPILAVLVWLTSEPRGLTNRSVVAASFIFPVLYAGWMFLHGAFTDWYPYPFIDVPIIGYGQALTMAALIFVAFAALSLVLWRLDMALLRVRRLDRLSRRHRERVFTRS